MTIDWNNDKRKAFRIALQEAYPSYSDLRIFVDEELDENLAEISTNSNLKTTAYELVKWAETYNQLDRIFEVFCSHNPNNPVIAKIERRSLITKSCNLADADWEALFEQFSPSDFADIQRAFLRGVKKVFDFEFREMRPDNPSLNELAQIQELLAEYDKPELAIRFVEFLMIELRRSSEERDLAHIEQWRDRIAQQHNIDLEDPQSIEERQGYLLLALQESGRQTQKDGAFVTVFSELHVTGEIAPIEFDASAVTCSLDEVAGHLSRLIRKAENALIPYQCAEVTLEVFLPCIHLEEGVAEWKVRDENNRHLDLGFHRSFVIRSLDRALNQTMHVTLKRNWDLLKTYTAQTLGDKFHYEECCSGSGVLKSRLIKKLGLQVLAELPVDRKQRLDIFYDIVNSAVPIALWSTQLENCTANELKTEFNCLLEASRLTNVADLAQNWRIKRAASDNRVIKNIRLLCDCPERLPSLPDPNEDEDLLVAS